MNTLISLHNAIFARLSAAGDIITPTLARFVFGAVLLQYYWASAGTKLDGFLSPSDGGYIQIFPKAVEAAGYDTSQLGVFHWVVVMAGTYAEYILPLLIIIGLLTRLAAIGMVGFVSLQSIVDITGHGVGGADLGAWFDKASGALIMDQRTLWVFVLLVLVVRGAGPFSVDRLLKRTVV
ncbi:DoxX family membrane protein [Nereida ignava]|uniref:DoxX family membrane protein n=1 Tax=Nereida ignava TaxID=282199 RepID=UPI0023B4D374